MVTHICLRDPIPGAAPVPDPDQILDSGFYTQINQAVQNLGINGGSATIAATLSIAASNAAGTSPFSAYLSQPASVLQAQLPQVETSPGQFVTIGLAAGANTAAVSTGTSTTGSYTRDLMRALATLGSLSSSQVNDAGFQQMVDDTVSSLQGVVGAVADDQAILGGRQNELSSAGDLLAASTTALKSQVSTIEDVNIASVVTQLSLTQASLDASYKMIVSLSADSLLNYLPTSG